MTKEEILQEVDLFTFFSKDLNRIHEAWNNAQTDDDSSIRSYVREALTVNKLLTVKRKLQYEENNKKGSSFKKNYFMKIITNPKLKRDEYGMIPKWGIYMEPEIYAIFEDAYLTLVKNNKVI